MQKLKSEKTDLKTAEAVGNIKTLSTGPAIELEETETTSEAQAVIDNPEEFRNAIGNAQLDGVEYLEVSQKLFDHLVKRSKTKYITYGSPGIKVYVQGTKEKYDMEENMSAEQYYHYLGKQIMEKKQNGGE